jgi:hypothetical protein
VLAEPVDAKTPVSKQRRIVRALVETAMRGDLRAISVLVSLVGRTGDDGASETPSSDDLEILTSFEARTVQQQRADAEPNISLAQTGNTENKE